MSVDPQRLWPHGSDMLSAMTGPSGPCADCALNTPVEADGGCIWLTLATLPEDIGVWTLVEDPVDGETAIDCDDWRPR